MSKANIAIGTVVMAALALAGLILILALTPGYRQGEDILSRQLCKESVIQHAKLHIKSFNPPAEQIKCPTAYLEIRDDKITYEYRGKKKDIGVSAGKNGKEQGIKKAMADEIYNCWEQFGEGKLDLFGGAKKYCNICSVISFKDKDTQVTGFYDYLMKNTVPEPALAKEGVTYLDYMQGYTKKGRYDEKDLAENRKAIEEMKMDTKSDYSVIFVYAKSEPFIDNTIAFLQKFWESDSGKTAVIGAALIAGGIAISLTGVGLPAGAAMIASAGGKFLIDWVIVPKGITGAFEAYSNKEQIKEWTAAVVFGRYDTGTLKNLGCEEIPLEP
ncbi:hypothetical protein HY640_04570 [Candidatus Woesearchaeota archaeon]|nr:hypothetical protein [Candidatus Woesearchaeota archaeon]